MKNKFLLSSALFLTTLVSAQVDLRNTRFGITGGATYSAVRHAHSPSGARFSGYAGLLALIPIDASDQFYIQSGVEYLGAGENGRDPDAKGLLGYDAVYSNNYISVPVYFKGYFSDAESEFFGVIGPRFNFLLNQNVKNAPLKYTIEGDPETGVNGKASGFNLAASFGLGFSFKRMVEVTARYDLGLSNTYKGLMKESGDDPNILKRKSELILSLGVSYIFD